MTKTVFISIVILLGLNSVSVQAKVYKFVDENGHVHYSEKKPVNTRSKQLDINSGRTSGRTPKIIKLIPTKNLDKAVREGKITENMAIRMRYFNIVSKEYLLIKKKKKAMKLTLASAKASRSTMSAEQIKHLAQQYDTFIKEEYYYIRRNYMVSRKKFQAFLDSHNNKKSSSLHKKNQGARLEWR
ncbi:MAG: DUF4124 domain-containing protein [Thiohalomonadales bacterium]